MSMMMTLKVKKLEQQVEEQSLRLEEVERMLRSVPPRPSKPIVEARAFLTRALADGPKHSTDVLQGAEEGAIAERTLRRAKSQMGVESIRVRTAPGRRPGTYWRLGEQKSETQHGQD